MHKLGFKNRIQRVGKQFSDSFRPLKHSLIGLGAPAVLVSAIASSMGASAASGPVFTVSQPMSIAVPEQIRLAEMSVTDAVHLVERQTGGKVLSVTEEERGARRVFRVKVLLPEGRVRTLFIDKQTGAQREG